MKENKKLPIIFSIALIVAAIIFIFGVDLPGNSIFYLNGLTFTGPFANMLGGTLGIIISIVTLFCVGVLLLFVLSGIGVILLTVFLFVGSILLAVVLPFLLPILIPFFILFLFIMAMRKKTMAPKKMIESNK